MLDPSDHKPLYLLLGITLFGVAFLGAYLGQVPAPEISVEWEAGQARYTPSYSAVDGRELAFVYIGSSGCAASNRPFLPETVKQLKLLIEEQARNRGRSFVAIGVARDWDVEAGLEHLEKFGPFDQVMAGRNWLNIGALKYIWEDVPGIAATPQVVVLDRRIETPEGRGAGYAIQDAHLLVRKVGTREIRRWLKRGAPLPPLEAPAEPLPSSTAQARK